MTRRVLFLGLWLCGVLANAAPPSPHHPKPPRAEVDLIRPLDGFFTQGRTAFQVEAQVVPSTRREHDEVESVVAVLFMDGQPIACQSTKIREPRESEGESRKSRESHETEEKSRESRATAASFTFPVDLTSHAEGAVSFQVRAYAGPTPRFCFWWKLPHWVEWCHRNLFLGESAMVHGTVDRTPPVVSVTQPADGASVTETQPTIVAVFSDALSGVDETKVSLAVDGQTLAVYIAGGSASGKPSAPLAVGDHQVTVTVVDRAGNTATAASSFQVAPALPPPVTDATAGQAIGTVYDAATRQPMAGAVVTVRDLTGGLLTAADGRYAFPVINFPDTRKKLVVVEFSAPGYVTSQQRILAYSRTPVTLKPVFLKKRDLKITPITPAGGVVENSDGTVVAEIPAGATATNLAVQLTLYNGGHELPGPLPKSSAFTYAVDLSPDGATFSQPVTIKIANSLGFAPGTPIPVGVYNPQEVCWEHESMGQISADGQWVVFQVNHFSVRDCNMPVAPGAPGTAPDGSTKGVNPSVNQAKNKETDPGVGIGDGSYMTEWNTPAYRTLGQNRGLTFVYQSRAAAGEKVVSPEAIDNAWTASPQIREFSLGVGGANVQMSFRGEPSSQYGTYVGTMTISLPELSTGLYPYTLKISNLYTNQYWLASRFGGSGETATGVTSRELIPLQAMQSAWMAIENLGRSSLGAGWSLQGLKALYSNADGSRVLMTAGDGDQTVFFQSGQEVAVSQRAVSGIQGLGHDASGGLLLAAGDRIVRLDAAGLSADVVMGLSGVVDVAESATRTIYFVTRQTAGRMAAAAVGGGGIHPMAVGGGSVGKLYRVDPHTGLPELLNNSMQSTSSLSVDPLGGVYVIDNYMGVVAKYDDAGGRRDVVNFHELGDFPVGVVLDVSRDRLLVTTSHSVFAIGRTGEKRWLISSDDQFLAGGGIVVYPDGVIAGLCRTTSGVVLKQWNAEGISLSQAALNLPLAGDAQLELDAANRLFLSDYAAGVVYELDRTSDNVYTSVTPQPQHLTKDTTGWHWSDTHGNTRDFDLDGKLLRESDRNGNATAYAYNPQGLLTSITDPAGLATQLAYDGNGKLQNVTDPAGRATSFAVDGNGNLTQVTFPDGARKTFAYDDRHRMVSKTDANGQTLRFTVDVQGFYRGITYADGTQTGFDAQRVKAAVAPDPVPGVTRGVAEPLADPVLLTDSAGFLLYAGDHVLDPRGNVSRWSLDGRGYLNSTTDALGATTRVARNDLDLVNQVTDPLGRLTSLNYDGNGNLIATVRPDGGQIQIAYTPDFNLPSQVTDPLGRQTRLTYDATGNLTQATDALGQSSQFTYNARGQVLTATDPLGNVTRYEYDTRGNVSRVTDPLNRTTEMTYDAAGNVTQVHDALGRVTQVAYDPMGRPTASTAADGGVTRATYDANGNVLTITDARNQVTTYTYDSMDRVLTETNPLGAVERYAYDAAGNLTSLTTRDGATIRHEYDARNERIKKSVPDVGDFNYQYDAVGNLLGASNPVSVIANTYDPLNRLLTAKSSILNPPFSFLNYSYDAVGNRIRMDDPTGTTTYGFDALNRLTSLQNSASQTWGWTFDAAGRLTSQINPNGTRVGLAFDGASQLLQIKHLTGVNPLAQFDYVLNAVGNRTRQNETVGAASRQRDFTYDQVDRLLSSSNVPEAFSYDSVGNQIQGGRTHDAANHLLQDAEFNYAYDANGNLIRKTRISDNTATVYTWDAENRLVGVTTPTASVAYRYDPFGRRIEKNVNGVITRYVYDGADTLLEADGTNVLKAKYTHAAGIDRPLMREELDAGGQTLAAQVYHQDGNNNVVALTDLTGTLLESYEYTAFGKLSVFDAAHQPKTDALQPFTFTGREWESETGLYYYRARYYDPAADRFISEDPIGFAGGDINTQAFCANNPIGAIDPLGLTNWKQVGQGTLELLIF